MTASLAVAGVAVPAVVVYATIGVVVLGLAMSLGWLWRRGRHGHRIGTPEDAAEAVEAALTGVRVAGAVVGADGTGALAVTDDGRVAAVKRLGARLIAREIGWRSVRSTATGILIETDDPRLGTIALAGVNVLDIRRLAPQLGSRFRAACATASPSLAGPSFSNSKAIAH
ncbi:hypothetical protein GCM10022268_03260 [Sphingomonas cynarae]|uniref:Uncharacterized protein n=1 Tax=Sphingomonas cynarae TaxID=930197 RepID=A0ABP7CVK0_9SPHN